MKKHELAGWRRRTPAALLIAAFGATLAGCGSSNSATQESQSGADSAGRATAASDAVATSSAADAGAAAPVSLPVYPGATKQSIPAAMQGQSMCGHKLTVASYESAADEKTIVAWYKAHVPGGVVMDEGDKPDAGAGANEITTEIMDPTGSGAVVVNQMKFNGANFASAGKMIGLDKADIGLETFTPPLGADYIALSLQAKRGDASAQDKLKAQCPNG